MNANTALRRAIMTLKQPRFTDDQDREASDVLQRLLDAIEGVFYEVRFAGDDETEG